MKVESTVSNIAQYYINRAYLDSRDNRGECITLTKLQRLLYFSQGCYGVINNNDKLFDADFVHGRNGPIVLEIEAKYSNWGQRGINLREESVDISNNIQYFLQNIYLLYGQYSTWRLTEMVFNELPWSTTKQDETITFESMTKYFKIYHDDRLNTIKIRDKKILESAMSLRDRGILDDDFIIKNFYKY
ncbi:MAG: DUF4065 domain-containing protein [Clostridiales bacterium]|jgi:uncharacterized phage-associated protein|nr:DUF4065 domain-containing protein [Clostridiales bacterium]